MPDAPRPTSRRRRARPPTRRAASCCRPSTSAASARRRSRSCCAWRRCAALARVVSLLALDFAGAVRGDLHRADGQGGAPRRRRGRGTRRFDEARRHDRVRLPRDACCCSRAPASTPSARSGPGLPRIVSSLFQVTVVALIFALVNGEQYSSYYIFYGTLVLRDHLRRRRCAGSTSSVTGVAAARRGLPPPRGARRLGQAHRGRRARARRRGARAGRDGRLHLAHAAAGQRPALARADRGPRRGARRATACRR